MFEDDRPRKPAGHEIGVDLAALSVDELQERITLLREEIARLEAELLRKDSTRMAAETLFSRG